MRRGEVARRSRQVRRIGDLRTEEQHSDLALKVFREATGGGRELPLPIEIFPGPLHLEDNKTKKYKEAA